MTTTAPRRRRHSRTKGRDHERSDRRAGLDILLARADRGTLSRTEAALLREYVAEERRTADESRKANAGSTRALARHREAADAAIVEAEERARQAEEIARAAHQCSNEAERHRAAADRALDRVRDLAHRMRAGSPMGAAAVYAERIEQALDGDLAAMNAGQTAMHAAFAEAAESTRACLAEQQRDHDIALATAEQRIRRLEKDARDNAADARAEHVRAKSLEQQLAAVRAALPEEPRPRLGLPTDLAYANGRHDLAERVRHVLDQAPA
ncbi:hypothetical protein SEA_RALEIGH_46 [Streptomyces phage Raleigh]|uniref:Uncharacterized protein n=1 Tax=Streptomyces phage Raleigh TaxID=1920312 RepID=A0A1J0MD02_9CAUD|nr:hypothetical protein [Streptomyces sp. MMBL 11-1]YP_009788305.1 hypothetical protein HOR46_gp46 [Streptomyces phage Raleigh]APD18794.1 hypothetical protein SEA_RALEIGH_46 [Streptomyces phage Raleigh]